MSERKKYLMMLAMGLSLSGCGADVEGMGKALQRANGWSANGAACYADGLAAVMDAEHYDYMAKLMVKGADMKTALNKVRRKFGASYSGDINGNEQLDACVK